MCTNIFQEPADPSSLNSPEGSDLIALDVKGKESVFQRAIPDPLSSGNEPFVIMLCKGAPEGILNKCSSVIIGDGRFINSHCSS